MQRLMIRRLKIGTNIAAELNTDFYITGPAGIAGDTVKLFESADLKSIICDNCHYFSFINRDLPFPIISDHPIIRNGCGISSSQSNSCFTWCGWS